MDTEVNRPELKRAALPLTEFTTIVCGVAATLAIAGLLSPPIKQGSGDAQRFSLSTVLLFTTCIVTIVRFYLGNFRHLDEQYLGGQGKSYSGNSRSPVGRRLAADFLVIIVESLLTVGLAYLLYSPIWFVFVYCVLLLFDAVWFYFFHDIDSNRAKYWVLNNLGFGVVFLVAGFSFLSVRNHLTFGWQQVAIAGFASLALVNTGLDVYNQFGFYFPSASRQRIVFLAAPFTAERDAEGVVNKALRDDLNKIMDYFRKKRYVVRSAHEREDFGKNLYSPARALRGDLDWLDGCGVVVAIMKGNSPSPGVQMELGAALALGKPIVQIVFPDANVPYLNAAFEEGEFGDARNIHVIRGKISSTTLDELGAKVEALCKAKY
jgi:nucleoside 2-deoxyribosyltransferase